MMDSRELGRRDFLKMMGVVATGAALGSVDSVWAVPEDLIKEALRGPGKETFKNSVCLLCPAGCGIKVRLIDGIPVHIDGNPMHPINRGGICPQGAAGLDFLYNPDRIRAPLVRTGPRGGGNWKEVGWDDALKQVVDYLKALQKNGTPEQLAFLVGEKRGLMYDLIARFMKSFGSRNILVLDEDLHASSPFEMLYGWDDPPAYDIEGAKFVLSFGANFLEDDPSPVHGIYAYGKMRENRVGGRARLVFVDSRHSLTAGSADRFVPIKLGTHGAFALGIAYVLVKERHYDVDFIKRHVHGFESWVDKKGVRHKGFKDYLLEGFYPEKVAKITGAPARVIVEIAREFGRIHPALAMVGQLGTDATNGLYNTLSVHVLNILVGNIEKHGGVRYKRKVPFKHLPLPPTDALSKEGLKKQALVEDRTYRFPFYDNGVLNFCDNIEAQDLYPINMLFVYGTNPAFDHPNARKIRQTLDQARFIVSFSNLLDETSEYADVILPDHSYLEKWMDSGPAPGVHFAHASVSQPVVEPLYNTRNAGDVLIDIAKRMGGTVSKAFPHGSFLETLKDRFEGIYTSGEGAVISGLFEESWVQFLKSRGWQNLVYESFEDFWKVLVERGGWWDPISEELSLRSITKTESRKIELYSLRFAKKVERLAKLLGRDRSREETTRILLEKWKIEGKGDLPFLPHFESPRFKGKESDYPYYLVTFSLPSNRNGSGSFSPLLQEMFGYYRRVYWDSWVELNPETAHSHHLEEGDWVRIASISGEIRARVVYNEALEQQVVAVPFGMGHTSGGRYSRGVGINPYNILAEETDYLWGRTAKAATRVKIEKLGRKIS